MNKLEYIFIDLDGTLLEGKHKHYNCYRDILDIYGGNPLEIDTYWNMKRKKVPRDVYLNESDYKGTYDNFLEEWIKKIEEKEYLKYDVLKPDVAETLKRWKYYADKLILITMRNNEKNLDWQLEKLDIKDLFDEIITCRCIENKDKYDFIKDYKINRAIVVGDTEDDIKLSLLCNIKSIAIINGIRDKEFLDADFYANEVSEIELEKIIKTIYT